jgi:hypothetical protein
LFFSPGDAVFRTEFYCLINIILRVLLKLYYLNIASVIVTEHRRAEFNTAKAQRADANINIRFPHGDNSQKLIINYGGISFECLFGLRIKLVGNIVYLLLLLAFPALHADLSALP